MCEHKQTANYKIITDVKGNRKYQFFCDISGALLCTAVPKKKTSVELELDEVWKNDGHGYFNHCRKCGKFVCDIMFNADVLECVFCAPWEEQPKFCPHCGTKVQDSGNKCCSCGASLRYGG